ncbi:General transcription factor II-I repeat domain-containing protein 2 [Frankliniella fusca]|uniref:General transcription factor II-I repeat domain-containing protein 2 n=1 Tax=Frankliniella fusca TaxID=407009 RepID=A0AAE1L7Q9_9NEOP|nr:General transcription factor II-I repeat domain-containing protein 2 [Frankliniella fusca]
MAFRQQAQEFFSSTTPGSTSNISDKALKTSYVISELIAKKGKPYADGLYIKECLEKSAEILCPDEKEKFQAVSLVTDLASSIEEQLRGLCKNFVLYSVALDESTDTSSVSQCALFIRGVLDNLSVVEELLDLVPMLGHTRGIDVFKVLEQTLEKFGLDWERFESVATDGAPSMCGDSNTVKKMYSKNPINVYAAIYIYMKDGLVARIRQKLKSLNLPSDISAIHCLIHQEALAARVIDFPHVMNVVVKTVNFIRANALQHRKFQTLLQDAGSDFLTVPYYTKVRWLSRGKVLHRFFLLREEINTFMNDAKRPVAELSDPKWIEDLAYFVDVCGHLNVLNTKMQGKKNLMTDLKRHIDAFKESVTLWKTQISSGDYFFFECVKSLDHPPSARLTNIMITSLGKLLSEFSSAFAELDILANELHLFSSPFLYPVSEAPHELQAELLDLRSDVLLKDRFNSMPMTDFVSFISKERFPNLWLNFAKVLAKFGSTYRCEQIFSQMKLCKKVYRSTMTNKHLSEQLRVMTSSDVKPNIAELMLKKKRHRSLAQLCSSNLI